MPIVKIKTNRQVTIPKTIFDELGLQEGQFIEVIRKQNGIFYKPKQLVDIDQDIAEALEDIKQGRVAGSFTTVKEVMQSLKKTTKS
ncbi:AbrB/MazE/SpoVT family DNA-binding domain-containing protein [Candidatus Acetothermia bacterium]|jgi:AbrB family looped-hinge helix DNA binding protein|nr:AbrB/MazE/SpoVT family DNA-binding domain-containing protein [Candidatus Acetothermia bacterium]